MPGQARKRSSEEAPVEEGELDPSTLDELDEPSGRAGDEPVIAVEMADDDEDDEADAEDEDEDEDEEEEGTDDDR